MILSEMSSLLELQTASAGDESRTVTGAYVSDMLSDVMSRAREGHVWLTMQSHQNVAAVATLLNLGAVIITGGRKPSPELIARASQENVLLYLTDMDTFEAGGRLYELLRRNT